MKIKKLSMSFIISTLIFGTTSVFGNSIEEIKIDNNEIYEKGEPVFIAIKTNEELDEDEFLSLSLQNNYSHQLFLNETSLEHYKEYSYGYVSTENLPKGRYGIIGVDIIDEDGDVISNIDSNINFNKYEFEISDREYEIDEVVSLYIEDTIVKIGDELNITANLENKTAEDYVVLITFENIIDEDETFVVELDKYENSYLLETKDGYKVPNVKAGNYKVDEIRQYAIYDYEGNELKALVKKYDGSKFTNTTVKVKEEENLRDTAKIKINNDEKYSLKDINSSNDSMLLEGNFLNDTFSVTIPYYFINDIYEDNNDFVYEIKVENFIYRLPVDIATRTDDIDRILRRSSNKDINIEDTSLKVTITNYTNNDEYKNKFSSYFKYGMLASDIYNVKLELLEGDKVLDEIDTFKLPIEKVIIANSKNENRLGAFLFDDGVLNFVPHKIDVSDNATVTINSIQNGSFAIVLNNVKFTDVVEGSWYEQNVMTSVTKGLSNGIGNNKFAPMAKISRAEFVSLIMNAIDLPNNRLDFNSIQGYDDVDKGTWYYDNIMTAKYYGILDEFDENTFNPSVLITREEMANIVGKVIMKLGVPINEIYIDLNSVLSDYDEVNPEYLDELQLVYKTGIMMGNNNGEFNPKDTATRAEAIQVQIKLLEVLNYL